jgi:transposase InsO family protein/transposase-like protein
VGRRPFKSPDEKLQIVLSVLRGEMTQVEIARRLQMSQTTIAKWQKQFLEGGREALARGDNAKADTTRREAELQGRVDELTEVPRRSLRGAPGLAQRGGALPPFEDLELIRREAGMPVRRFVARLGIPSSTWYYWRAAEVSGRAVRRWPAPVVDAIEEDAARKAYQYSAWGHRKIWAMLRADGAQVSRSSVKRALARRELLLPVRYQAERRALARARRATFDAPPVRRNRVWQMDFSEFETTRGGTWQLGGVIDYVAKYSLACPASGTQTAADAVAAVEAAMDEAERILAIALKEDLVDPETGEVLAIVLVTDNGPAFKSSRFQLFISSRPELTHVRTRHRSPQTNGVIERFFESVKYDHLYRQEIADGHALHEEVQSYRRLYNEIRPHEHLDFGTPLAAYLAPPE